MTKFICEIDGGGIKCIIPAVVLSELELVLGKPCYKIFDLITGTSTGAILGGCLAAGIPANEILNQYINQGKQLFTAKPWWNPANWLGSTYDRKPFIDMINKNVGPNTLMKDVKTKLMVATFGKVAQRTHFIKSYDDYHSTFKLTDVISWSSLCAVKYFGSISNPDFKWTRVYPDMSTRDMVGEVFQDGGQGINNCTLACDVFELLSLGWESDIVIVSLGTGDYSEDINYHKESNENVIEQGIDFLGEARNESTPDFVIGTDSVSKKRDKFKFVRININLPKAQDALDAVKYINDFKIYGETLAKKIDPSIFKV